MADLITHSLTFYKESVTEYFLKPLFVESDIRDIITIRTDIKSSEKLDYIGKLDKITKKYAKGTAFTASTGVVITQKTLTVVDMKAQVNQNGKAFLNWVKQAALKLGVNENNIAGTVFEQIVMSIFIKGIARDLQRQMFFGDVNAETLSGGFPTGTANTDYKEYNGFWKRLIADVTSGTIPAAQRVTVANGAIKQKDTHSLTGISGTANIAINGLLYLATFATDLTTTATNFKNLHAAALLLRGIVVTSSAADVILEASIPGVAFTSTAAANVSGTLAGTKVATTANTAPAALATDEAISIMTSMVAAATNELMESESEIVIMVTRSILENYKTTLRTLNGSEASVETLLNGKKVLSFDGFPLVVRKDWDTHIAADFPGQYPHRAAMTIPLNFVFGTDGVSDDLLIELIYDAVAQENIFRVEYKAGTEYVHPELLVVAY